MLQRNKQHQVFEPGAPIFLKRNTRYLPLPIECTEILAKQCCANCTIAQMSEINPLDQTSSYIQKLLSIDVRKHLSFWVRSCLYNSVFQHITVIIIITYYREEQA